MKNDRLTWLPPLLFLLLSVVLLWPFFLGDTLMPADSLKSLPLSRFGRQEFFGSGRIVQWIPFLFGGMPCYSSVMVTPSYLVSAVFTWGLGSFIAWFSDPLAQHLLHLTILGWGAWCYLRLMGLRPPAAAVAAANLVLLTTLTGLVGAGHTIKLWTVCWMPFTLYWLERLLRGKDWRGLAWGALVLGLMLTAKHVQMSWYFLLLAGIYCLVRLVQKWRVRGPAPASRAGGRALLLVLLGLGLAAFLYLPVMDYSGLSMRSGGQDAVASGEYAASYSYPPGDLPTWVIPGARGFGGGEYWGSLEYTAFPLYMGALWLPLLVLAFFDRGARNRLWAWLIPALALFLLGIGRYGPLFDPLLNLLPFYGKFRAHMWALAPAQMLLVFGAGLGLDFLLGGLKSGGLRAAAAGPAREIDEGRETQSSRAVGKRRGKKRRGSVDQAPDVAQRKSGPRQEAASASLLPKGPGLWLLGAGAALLLLALFIKANAPDPSRPLAPGDSFTGERDTQILLGYFQRPGVQPSRPQLEAVRNQLRTGRALILAEDGARTLLWLGLALLAGGLFLAGRLRREILAGVLVALLLLDLLPMDRRTMNFEPRRDPTAWFRPQGVMVELAALPGKENFRVWTRDGYGYNEAAWHGLHSITGYHGAKPALIQQLLDQGMIGRRGDPADPERLHPALLDLLNVHYVISREELPGTTLRSRGRDGLLLENPDPLPRISFPASWRRVPGEGMLAELMTGDIDLRETALLAEAPQGLPEALDPGAEGRILSYEPDRVEYEIRSRAPALALLSEIWLPRGWTARLNGREVPLLRADHLLRAVALPDGGTHRLVLEYAPLSWRLGLALSLLSLLIVLGLLLVFRKTEPSPEEESESC